MTEQNKQLLLQDLCARLPYGVNCKGFYYEEPDYKTPYEHIETSEGHVDGIDHIGFDDEDIYIIIEGIPCELSNVKPYLRPLSSMPEEERKFFLHLENATQIADFYYAHHFDCRGLIDKGLALEAPKDMYK